MKSVLKKEASVLNGAENCPLHLAVWTVAVGREQDELGVERPGLARNWGISSQRTSGEAESRPRRCGQESVRRLYCALRGVTEGFVKTYVPIQQVQDGPPGFVSAPRPGCGP